MKKVEKTPEDTMAEIESERAKSMEEFFGENHSGFQTRKEFLQRIIETAESLIDVCCDDCLIPKGFSLIINADHSESYWDEKMLINTRGTWSIEKIKDARRALKDEMNGARFADIHMGGQWDEEPDEEKNNSESL